ncbi:hypothetical protein [Phormidesmis sp. 146-33]
MKRPGLFKTLRTLSLMTMLSIVTIPNIPKTAQAQTQGIPDGIEFLTREQLEQARLDALEDSKICDRVLRENSNVQSDGGIFFDDFQGVNLTDAQKKAYAALDAQKEARMAELYKQTISVADPLATIGYMTSSPNVPKDLEDAIQAALDRKPTTDQLDAINQEFEKRFGKDSVLFYGSYAA